MDKILILAVWWADETPPTCLLNFPSQLTFIIILNGFLLKNSFNWNLSGKPFFLKIELKIKWKIFDDEKDED